MVETRNAEDIQVLHEVFLAREYNVLPSTRALRLISA